MSRNPAKDRWMRENIHSTHSSIVADCQDVMNYHRYNIAPLNDLLMAASSPTSSMPHANKSSDVIRIAWLRRFTSAPSQVNALLDKFSNAGMDVWLVNGEHLPLEQILCFDLILLESTSQPASTLHTSLSRIRSGSRAPLILLTDDYSAHWSIEALQAGADAILPLNTSSDVILARCRSLLRRWLSDV